MKWDYPLMMMRQQGDHPSTGDEGNGANERRHKVDGEDRRDEEQQQHRRQHCRSGYITMLLIIASEWISIHSTPYHTSYKFHIGILSSLSTVAIIRHYSYHSMCVVSLLIDNDQHQRQFILWFGSLDH